MRGEIKLKRAMEYCNWAGSVSKFRSVAVGESVSKTREDSGNNLYSPSSIRQTRLELMNLGYQPERARELPPIIYVRMPKGGVGKTTVVGNVAACMAQQGYKVLMIDADPQASLTSLFGIDWASAGIIHLGHLLYAQGDHKEPLSDSQLKEAIRPIYEGGMLDLIAADITLTNIDTWLTQQHYAREKLVQEMFLAHVDVLSRYDVILIDGAPGTSQLSFALMYAAKNLLAVVSPDGQSMMAMEVFQTNVNDIQRAYPSEQFTTRIVVNGYIAGIKASLESLETLRKAYPSKVDPNVIPHCAPFVRQVSLQDHAESGPVIEKEPSSQAARSIIDLTQSLIQTYDVRLAGVIPIVAPVRPGPKGPRTNKETS